MEGQKLKTCRYCGREFVNLGQHIANSHPSVLEKIEETGEQANSEPRTTMQSMHYPEYRMPTKTVNDVIMEKIDLLANIKVLQVLSNPNSSLQDLQGLNDHKEPEKSAIEQLRDFKEVADMFHREGSGEGNDWPDVAIHSMPVIKEMLRDIKVKRQGGKTDENRRSTTVNQVGTARRFSAASGRDKEHQRQSDSTQSKSGDSS